LTVREPAAIYLSRSVLGIVVITSWAWMSYHYDTLSYLWSWCDRFSAFRSFPTVSRGCWSPSDFSEEQLPCPQIYAFARRYTILSADLRLKRGTNCWKSFCLPRERDSFVGPGYYSCGHHAHCLRNATRLFVCRLPRCHANRVRGKVNTSRCSLRPTVGDFAIIIRRIDQPLISIYFSMVSAIHWYVLTYGRHRIGKSSMDLVGSRGARRCRRGWLGVARQDRLPFRQWSGVSYQSARLREVMCRNTMKPIMHGEVSWKWKILGKRWPRLGGASFYC
jgi:hypothetical protein